MLKYNETFSSEQQVDMEEHIAAMILDYQNGLIELDNANSGDDHTFTEEDCQQLSQNILNYVVSVLRPDYVDN